MSTMTRSEYELKRLSPRELLNRLIYEMGKPLELDEDFTNHMKSQREMGCSHLTQEYERESWKKSTAARREKERDVLVQYRNEGRGKRAARIMADLGDRFDHYSFRSIDSRGHGPCVVYIYERDSSSPSGVMLAGSEHDCPEVRAAVGAGGSEYVGARSGQMSGFQG